MGYTLHLLSKENMFWKLPMLSYQETLLKSYGYVDWMSKKYQFNHIKQYAQEGLTFQERPELEPDHQHPPTYEPFPSHTLTFLLP